VTRAGREEEPVMEADLATGEAVIG
jgi:hypothetical protein